MTPSQTASVDTETPVPATATRLPDVILPEGTATIAPTETQTFPGVFLPTRPPFLADAVLNGNEVQNPILENYMSVPVYTVTEEMRPECWEDCVKRAWTSTYRRVIIQLNRGKTGEVSNYGLNTLYQAYTKFGAAFQIVDAYDGPGDRRWAGNLMISANNYEFVDSAVVGEIQATIFIRNNFLAQIPEGETGASDYQKFLAEAAQRDAADLLNLQLNKLAWVGFEPAPDLVYSVVTSTPRPTPVLPPARPLELTAFLDETANCKLPCWNQLTPGLSTEEEVAPFFQRFGLDAESAYRAQCIDLSGYPAGNASQTDPQVCVFSNDGIVNRIRLSNWSHPEQFSPKRINIVLGTPDVILVPSAPLDDPDGFAVVFIYPNQGVALEIHGRLDLELQGYMCISDRRFQSATVTFFSDDQRFLLQQEYQSSAPAYVDWSQARGETAQTLFNLLINPERCVPYPAYRK